MQHKKIPIQLFSVVAMALLFALLIGIFFHQLGQTALQSYDEAWYAVITRNLVRSKDPFFLTYNGQHFTDHPPLGYWLMAVPTGLFGSSEFAVRSVSALLGLLSIALIYLIGKKIAGWQMGVSAALVLLSSLWFMLRARSGNLDIPFVFWELVVFYGIIKIPDDKRFLLLVGAGFGALFLTKTFVGVGILPLILVGLWLNRKKITGTDLTKVLGITGSIILPWYLFTALKDPGFLYHHFFVIGSRGVENSYQLSALSDALLYLQIGIGRWYKVFWVALVGSVALFTQSTKKERVNITLLWLGIVGFGTPFLISSKTEVWHWIPVYPFIALIIGYTALRIWNLIGVARPLHTVLKICTLLAILGVGSFQFYQMSNLLYGQSSYSAEKIIAQKAGAYGKPIYLLETFYPATLYYADQPVAPIHWDENAYETAKNLLLQPETEGVFIMKRVLYENLVHEGTTATILEEEGQYVVVE